MAQLLVRNLDDQLKARLRERALSHGHSMEEEAREIFRHALRPQNALKAGLGTEIAALFRDCGLEDEIRELRGHPAQPAEFDPASFKS